MATETDVETYPVGRVSRLTGISPDLLRAWERRYQAVDPIRTPGGTRRYRASDVERLRLLKRAVDAGHRISAIAPLSSEELDAKLATRSEAAPTSGPALEEVLATLERLDGVSAEQQISAQMAVLGPVRFAKEFALPLLHAIGEGWQEKRLCMAAEHLGSALLRSLLGSALRPTAAHRDAPIVVFGTLTGERHEMGLLIAALTALGAGANPLYLGADLPLEELKNAAETAHARAVALSAVVTEPDDLRADLEELRDLLPSSIELWLGGPVAAHTALPVGVHGVESLDHLERRVEMLRI